jgi:hypothetical protein
MWICKKDIIVSCLERVLKKPLSIYFSCALLLKVYGLLLALSEMRIQTFITSYIYIAKNDFRQSFFMDIFLIDVWCL